MVPGAFEDASLARRKLQHFADPVPGEPRRGTGACRMDGIFQIMALFEHFFEPGRGIGREKQCFLASSPKVDVMKQREPAEAEFARSRIDRAMQFAEVSSAPTFCCKARKIIKAAAVFNTFRHRG